MANDIDMLEDIEELDGLDAEKHDDLLRCYTARYIDGEVGVAERLKEDFQKKYGHWDNYY